MEKINIFRNPADFFAASPRPPFLGIDWGGKTVGLAVSDDNLVLASPLKAVPAKQFMTELAHIVHNRKIGGFVIGYPIEMSGNIGTSAQKVDRFSTELSTAFPDLPILLEDERLSSYAAERLMIDDLGFKRKKRKESIDSAAAAVILQSVLDSQNTDRLKLRFD